MPGEDPWSQNRVCVTWNSPQSLRSGFTVTVKVNVGSVLEQIAQSGLAIRHEALEAERGSAIVQPLRHPAQIRGECHEGNVVQKVFHLGNPVLGGDFRGVARHRARASRAPRRAPSRLVSYA